MMISSVNPASGQEIQSYQLLSADAIETILANTAQAQVNWMATSFQQRGEQLRAVAEQLRNNKDTLARLITSEMGKLIGEAEGEIDKCAWVCDYYADNGARFLADNVLESDASRSLVAWQPLGTVLAVMPWNFPFWQVFRCAAPALMAGNTVLLKHASNVPGCALMLEQLFQQAGFPASVFSTLLISSGQVAEVIADPRVHAVSLTGSEKAGRSVAASAGEQLKKCVLELGGSDAFVVLEDAELDAAVEMAVRSRFLNTGQSCIAAKRFIVVETIADAFVEKFQAAMEQLRVGDPLDRDTTLAPMAREDLRDGLHRQVSASVNEGALLLAGGEPLPGAGWYYAATLLDQVQPGMPAYDEETFGPLAAVIRARDEDHALGIANDSRFGLGGCVWSGDDTRGEAFARRMECGCAFVNGMVKSDPRLPFGGIKHSGYGRELSLLGIREFVNAKTLWVK
jgi:succinate-semialdehyde dehydrogenase/glutarate-semialdehyde dehydrogenase